MAMQLALTLGVALELPLLWIVAGPDELVDDFAMKFALNPADC
jgi:hypothetical protein